VLPRTFIDRLMTNLVDNALEHGEPPVEIRTARRGDEWLIEVRDHGPGIPAERIEDAMRPFVRLDPARSGDGHCGLGLAIVARLAREQNGRCEIGNADGGGLIVRIVLPVSISRDSRDSRDFCDERVLKRAVVLDSRVVSES
jgi:two-component system, OmpR family, osmolarity sensor histidine kinase EnvZ